MGTTQLWKTVTLFIILHIVSGQENAQTRVPQSLHECYRDKIIYERDNRLPMTINTLINLIRKIEDTEGLNMDITTLAVALIHRFKQDGIERIKEIQQTDLVLPFSPKGHQFAKHKILLSRLIPGDARRFPNETLTIQEQCTLHFMISNSIDLHVRGDEPMQCSSLAQYRTNRIPRAVDSDEKVEERFKHPRKIQTGKLRKEEGDIDEYEDDDNFGSRTFGVDTDSNLISACPVENGVIRTTWGAIAPGTLLTGIAAGLKQQNVRVLEITPRKTKQGMRARQSIPDVVDNRWAATLSGDLAEAALLQGPKENSRIQVGAKGAWNSTTEPKWYFLSQKDRHEMTDAEIRGGIDGLIIAKKIEEWRNNFGALKLSQVLSMYYSMVSNFINHYDS